jgi:GAF domain-containing protein
MSGDPVAGGPSAALAHAGPRHLRRLVEAVLSVGSHLELDEVLGQIVAAAVELVDAAFGALGVLDESGTRLARFLTVGLDDEGRAAIGAPPKGLGLLGELITDGRPLRVAQLDEHPASSGFPANHPPMTSFLGVPIQVRGEAYGNLYLTDKRSAEVFSDVDEELVTALATAAGIAIDNARLYDQQRRREAGAAAVQEIATAIVAGAGRRESLELIARHARALLSADLTTIGRLEADGDLHVQVADGEGEEELLGMRYRAAGTVSGDVLATGSGAIVEDVAVHPGAASLQLPGTPFGPGIFVPLRTGEGPAGVLRILRTKSAPPFLPVDLEMAATFAAQASLVLDHERHREQAQRLERLQAQERLAGELHDRVVQELFAASLSLQGALRLSADREVGERLTAAIGRLDRTIVEIRTLVFEASRPAAADRP